MKKVLNVNYEAGSRESNEPRLLGSIVEEMLHGKSPLAKGYRQYIASLENEEAEEQGWHSNTELCIDLKTILRSDRKAKNNKDYQGVLTRDGEEHFSFVETQPTSAKRNPRLFRGKYITITRWADGSLHPNFRPMPNVGAGFRVEHYAFEVYRELFRALKGLVEE